uniref:Peptidase A1 domain-containing protein n=1 Tax=Panagrellus redivivus TaxID=6233 RepID=A0A7E4ZQQ3_PANRE
MPRVVINDAKETVFEMRLNGESCTFMPLIVPKKGFQFSIDATRVGRKVFLGYITFSFGDVLVNKSTLMITEDKNRVETYMQPGPEDYIEIAEVRTSTTTYTVFPNGSVMVLPLWFTQPFYIPPIENLPDFNADEKILILTINWGNLTDKFQLIFPSEIRFLLPVQNSTVIPQLETTKIVTLVATTQSNVSVSVTTRFFEENWWRIVDGIGVVFAFSGVFIAGVMVYKIIHLIRNVPVESQSMSTVPSTETTTEQAATLTGQQNGPSTVPGTSTVDPSTATSSVCLQL